MKYRSLLWIVWALQGSVAAMEADRALLAADESHIYLLELVAQLSSMKIFALPYPYLCQSLSADEELVVRTELISRARYFCDRVKSYPVYEHLTDLHHFPLPHLIAVTVLLRARFMPRRTSSTFNVIASDRSVSPRYERDDAGHSYAIQIHDDWKMILAALDNSLRIFLLEPFLDGPFSPRRHLRSSREN